MGQKVNPHGIRVGVIKDWDSRWYADKKNYGDNLVEDYNLRVYLKNKLFQAGVDKIEIEKLKKEVENLTGKTVILNVIEIKTPDMSAQLVAENIASQLERRISFRKAMKQCMTRTMKMGAKGIKTAVSGRVGGAEIARTEQYHEGTIPLQTLRADIDYGFTEANTTYGKLGVKVWIYKGEVLAESKKAVKEAPAKVKEGGRK